ncbi:phage terminase small subunit P27 family, partial [Enterobacter cloacae complex sp. ECNIH16]
MSGPPKTPTHLRLVRGNPSKRPINENEPKPA